MSTDFDKDLKALHRDLTLTIVDARFRKRWDDGNEKVRVTARLALSDPQAHADALAAMHRLNDEYMIGLAESFRDFGVPPSEGAMSWDEAIARMTRRLESRTEIEGEIA